MKKEHHIQVDTRKGRIEHLVFIVSVIVIIMAVLPWFAHYTELGRWAQSPLELFNDIMISTLILLLGGFIVYLIYTHHETVQNELVTDPLTQVYNMRFFSEKLHWVFVASKRTQLKSTLLFVDIDGFKKYNDQYGHLKGNEILAAVGSILLRSTRKYVDWPFRVGGDEFAVLMEFSDKHSGAVLAHRLASRMDKEMEGLVTLTIGMAEVKESMHNERDWVTAADAAMYKNKKKGLHP